MFSLGAKPIENMKMLINLPNYLFSIAGDNMQNKKKMMCNFKFFVGKIRVNHGINCQSLLEIWKF